jgi:hypothetical protein
VQREKATGNAEIVEQEGGERRRGEESQGRRNFGFVKVAVVNGKSLEHLQSLAQYVNLHNYFSHSKFSYLFPFSNPTHKTKIKELKLNENCRIKISKNHNLLKI